VPVIKKDCPSNLVQLDDQLNTSMNEYDPLQELKVLAGITNKPNWQPYSMGSNVSITGQEKADLQRKHDIRPGTPEWFKLWFSKPYLTGEKPI
jgi:hypothetical protein